MPSRIKTHRPARVKTAENRPSSHARGYTRAWSRYSKSFLSMHPTCVGLDGKRCDEPSEHVDHIQPVEGPDDPLFWDPENHQALCRMHHSIKTAKHDGGFGRKKR